MYIYQVEREILQQGLAELGKGLKGNVLDVGSGPSKKYQSFLGQTSEYVRLDNNPEFKPDILSSADSIPVKDCSFDSIVCVQVLGDLLRPEKAIKEFYRILSPGGQVLITEGFMNELHGEPRDYWRFTPYVLSQLLEENGFKVREVKILGGFFTVITQMFSRIMINTFNLYDQKIMGRVFSKFFFVLGKVAINLDKILNNKANLKFGTNVIGLAEKPDQHEI